MKAVVIAHGDVADEDRDALADANIVIAADGGALVLDRWGRTPDLLVGDLDSVGEEGARQYGKRGVTVVRFPAEKDETDLEIALRSALESGAEEIVVLGAFGGTRLDHELANFLLLADPRYRGRVRAIFGRTTVCALHGGDRVVLGGSTGDGVSLVPVYGHADDVRTEGLRYALEGEPLVFGRPRGVSNVIVKSPASVSLGGGILLVVEVRERRD